ncbi:phospho-N-acetylmuramoyl-pentapeptide-transferase, partial [Thermodesulfobacteriota bacterium]
MLYHLLYPLHNTFSALNVFRYITFRTIYGGLTAFLICFLMGPWMIQKLSNMQIGQYIREDGPKTHLKKAGTPTMGGTLMLFSIVVSTVLWADLSNYFVWIVLMVAIGFGLIGFIDDYLMQVKKQSKGLSVRSKLALQAVLAIFTGVLVYFCPDFDTRVTLPFLKKVSPDLGWGYIIFSALVIIGTSNAVNLTDGLDGLAIGPFIVATG